MRWPACSSRRACSRQEEFQQRLDSEADYLSAQYAKKFPGFKATDIGIEMNPAIAADTTRGWRP